MKKLLFTTIMSFNIFSLTKETKLKITKENNLLCLEDDSVKECFDAKKIYEMLMIIDLTKDKASKEAISTFLSAIKDLDIEVTETDKTISLSGNIVIQKP